MVAGPPDEQRTVAGDSVKQVGVVAEFLALAIESQCFLVEVGERLLLSTRRQPLRRRREVLGRFTVAQ